MNKMKIIYPVLLGTLCLFSFSCGSKKDEEAQTQAKVSIVEKVNVMKLEKQTVAHTIEYPSTLAAFEENYLTSASPGRIEKIFVEIGSRVTKGQLLVQMDRTQYYQAEVQLQNLATDFQRMDTLNKVGSISKQVYDQTKTQYDIAKSNVDYLAENTKLLAPFSGVISGKYFENGEMYSGSPNTAAGKAAIVSLVQIDNLKSFVSIPESYFPLVKIGMPVELTCDIYSGQLFKGNIFRIHPTIDAGSRTFQVEVKVPNGKELLRPGMFCRVTLELGEEQALMAPAYAVLKLQGSNDRYVFVAENGKAKRVNVTLGKRFDDQIEIMANGVKEGDKIVVSGQSRLVDGVDIDVVEEVKAAKVITMKE
ncbi:MAG: efflux RND transporter periplasmic adaptor subunit [Prevotellaceae bacterium]|jgi:RND family efflux transporter MFP subunit|nr:efflux RND transporter periplasmic adaptor subunit [Prevotellaceae bacterium]